MNYWKSVYSCDLDRTVSSGVSDGSLLQLMVQSPMSGELCMWWNLCLFSSVFLIGFLSGCYFINHLLDALYMVWRSFKSTPKNDSRFCLLLRARVAISIKQIERMPYCELIRVQNCHAPLLYLEDTRQLSSTIKLGRIMKDASISELSYLNNSSDIISRHVEQVLSQNLKYVKQQRLWGRISCKLNRICFDDHTIEKFQLILLVLSLFETADEELKTVILYGVPGLPSVSPTVTATYAEIRAMIVRRAPNLRNFYFVAHGRIIQIEDTVIDWGSGHLVLNVHTTRDLPGGSERGSSDNESKDQNRNNLSDFQRLLVSDASGDEDFDGSISLGVSESESFQDSDSSWDLEKNKQRNRKRRNTKRGKYTSRTSNDRSMHRNRDAQRVKVLNEHHNLMHLAMRVWMIQHFMGFLKVREFRKATSQAIQIRIGNVTVMYLSRGISMQGTLNVMNEQHNLMNLQANV